MSIDETTMTGETQLGRMWRKMIRALTVAKRSRGLGVGHLFLHQRHAAHDASDEWHVEDAQGQRGLRQAGPERRDDRKSQEQRRKREQHVPDAGHRLVDPSAPIGGPDAERHANHLGNQHDRQRADRARCGFRRSNG